MSRAVTAVLVAASLLIPPAPAAGAAEEYTFVGSGWGHGVGFSQYGARGQAIENPARTGEDIAAYYYQGSAPASIADLDLSTDLLTSADHPLWVGLAQNVHVLEVTAVGARAELCRDGGCGITGPPPGETWTFETVGDACGWFADGGLQGTVGSCAGSVTWPAGAGVEVRDLTNAPLICGSVAELDRCQYRRGRLELRADPGGTGFHVSLAVGLEEYLYGLRELPDGWWRANVNQAQVVAARSYAAVEFLAREDPAARTGSDPGLSATQQDLCWCHTYDDTRDQYYVGYDKELGAPHWVEAVDATQGRVLTYFGEDWEWSTESGILQGFYSSSPGAWTESNKTGFGSSVQYPYLHPVPDPWSSMPEAQNPYATWTETFSAAELSGLLGVDAVVDAALVTGQPGAVVEFTVVDGGVTSTIELSGASLRSTLGLRSAGVGALNGEAAAPPGPPPVFADIAGSVHEQSILELHAAGITVGCTDSSFCVNDEVLRGQMASFISRALDLPAAQTDHATDDARSVHQDNINRVYAAGIAVECATGRYCPDVPITREHMAVFLYRALDLPDAENDVFTDDDESQYQREINAIAVAGITLGCADDSFCPDAPVSRGQMASFLVRAFLAPGGESIGEPPPAA